jgi:hypothetical protein
MPKILVKVEIIFPDSCRKKCSTTWVTSPGGVGVLVSEVFLAMESHFYDQPMLWEMLMLEIVRDTDSITKSRAPARKVKSLCARSRRLRGIFFARA